MPGAMSPILPPWLTDLADARIVTPGALAKLALRYEHRGLEELLAHLASNGELGHRAILDLAAAGSTTGGRGDALRAAGLYALALLTIGTPAADAVERSADLFALARTVAERTGARTEHADLELQTALSAGREDTARALIATGTADPWVRWAAAADLVNPFGDARSAAEPWLAEFNRPFIERGLDPIAVGDHAAPFDSLSTSTADRAGTVGGPLVTIVVSVFKPTESLLAAVGSLVAQTWRDLQIIIVDDASPDEHLDVLERARALDPRVEYVRMPANGGAYRARNTGIRHARGEFVGFQDGDDWSHPQRIERQMRAFTANVVATLSNAVWLYGDLRMTVPGAAPYARIAPSLILRRDPVLERLGPFDDMRRAADTEFIERLAAVFGRPAVVTVDEPLSLYQLTHGSLSRGDFRLGWRRDARVSYHSAFRHWHRQVAGGRADPVILSDHGRAFPAPPEIEGTEHPASPDVVVLADFRPRIAQLTGLPAELTALSRAGLQVGLARGEAPRHAAVARAYPHEGIQRVVADGLADWRPLSADLTPRLLLVRDPDLLAFSRAADRVRMRPQRVLVLADRLPRPEGHPRVSYDPAHVEQVAREMFGIDVEWLPATAALSDALLAAGAQGARHAPVRIDAVDLRRFPARLLSERPVIGVADGARFGAERVDPAAFGALPAGDTFDVRILEPADRPRKGAAAGWLGVDQALLTPTEFFDQCDFVVGLPARVHGTVLSRPVLDAMARGCVPIVHPSLRTALGPDVAVFGERSIAEIVTTLWSEPQRYVAAQRSAVEFCHNETSPEAFAGAVTRIMGTEAS
ncbi:glycosyltransferase [Aeromicrobium sp. NPDC092404]|uniref:glycosyltransferase family 2 protein n=1 Tax=Aeromicrobium sp. NPDC092404 TaxID=3154976 RepID=UPI00344125DF